MKILAITQARIGSTRFHRKILQTIGERTLLEIHLMRILKSRLVTKIKVATTTEPEASDIALVAAKCGIDVYHGSVDNVLKRLYDTALNEEPDWIVRLTSDCPLIDPELIDMVIRKAVDSDVDYASNTLRPTYPDGLDVEVFKFSALTRAMNEATLQSETEHVTPYIWKNSSYLGGTIFSSDGCENDIDLSGLRLTVDTPEDFMVIHRLVSALGIEKGWRDYVAYLEASPELMALNIHNTRNEGYQKSLQKDQRNG
jgi:spore coat polysaccharide biosynthesis protein SpsF (cytidylyltransferase family)